MHPVTRAGQAGGAAHPGTSQGLSIGLSKVFHRSVHALSVWADLWETVSRRLWATLWATPDGKECAGSAAHTKKAGAGLRRAKEIPQIHDLRDV